MLNILSRLSLTNEVRVVSYDLRCNEPVRWERLSSGFDIVDTKLTDSDRDAFWEIYERLGIYPHDVMCIDRYSFSAPFLREVRRALDWADAIVVSHPFLAPEIFSRCAPRHLRIFEAHNVELTAKTSLFAAARDRALADELLAATRRAEAYAIEAADIVLTVSEGDRDAFMDEYGVDQAKLHIVPNGVTVGAYDAISSEACRAFRAEADLTGGDVGVFLGSAYGPNVDAYRIARAWLDQAGFKGTVFVVGKIADAYDDNWPPVEFTEKWFGFVDDGTKHLLVKAADFAIQIVTSGGGTNLKLFDYMAAGIPILANEFGRRGVSDKGWFVPVETAADMRDTVRTRRWHDQAARASAEIARGIALRDYDWGSIAQCYRTILA